MRCRPTVALMLLALTVAAAATEPLTRPATAPADPAQPYRDRFAIAGRLDVTSVAVDDRSQPARGTSVAMTCRLLAAGAYDFSFDAYHAGGPPRTVTVAWPAPTTRFASVRPGGIHGGPPRVGVLADTPIVLRDPGDPAVVTVRWSYGDAAAPGGRYGYQLAKTSASAPAK